MDITPATFDQVVVGDTVLRFDGTGSVPVTVTGKTSVTDSGHRVIHTDGIRGGDIPLGAGGTVDKVERFSSDHTPNDTGEWCRRCFRDLNGTACLDDASEEQTAHC